MKLTKLRLINIIRETIKEVSPEHMPYGETPEGGLDPEYTREEDIRFRQQLEQENVMKRAGLGREEMAFVFRALGNPDVARGFLDTSAYEKLYTSLDIPYDIDSQSPEARMTPDEWIIDYLNSLGSTMRGGPASMAAEQKNRKITKSQLLKIIREELYKVFYDKERKATGAKSEGEASKEVEAGSPGQAMKKVQDENPSFHVVKAVPVKKEKDKK